MAQSDFYGIHRALEPAGVLPQAALRIDNDVSALRPTEALVRVETLHIDSASFLQMKQVSEQDPERVAMLIRKTVEARGKQHNPVTGSGGMLLGTVERVGEARGDAGALKPGERIATLVSLTSTPLRLTTIKRVDLATAQVDVDGHAILFGCSPYARMPADLPARVALAVFDVCGAPALAARLGVSAKRALVLGAGGKSGVLVCAALKQCMGAGSAIIGVEAMPDAAKVLGGLGYCDHVVSADAREPLAVYTALQSVGGECDLAFSCVNVDGAEMAPVLAMRQGGTVVYFSMNTSFTRAALGAESVGKDVVLQIGNGFVDGHADLAIELVRRDNALRAWFERRVGA